jgi:hypothetical protein
MKYILIILFAFTTYAQSPLLTLFDSGTTTPLADTLDTNMINNSTFEAVFSDVTNWASLFGGAISRSTEQVQSGTYSAKVISAGVGTGMEYYRDGNLLSVVVDSTYWVEGYYYVVSGAANILIETPLGNTGALTIKNTWTYFKFQITATSTTDIYLRIGEYSGGGNTTFYIDNLTVKRRL